MGRAWEKLEVMSLQLMERELETARGYEFATYGKSLGDLEVMSLWLVERAWESSRS